MTSAIDENDYQDLGEIDLKIEKLENLPKLLEKDFVITDIRNSLYDSCLIIFYL